MMSMTRLSAVLLFVVTATVAPARGQAPDYLNILWRVQLGGQDYMSTVSSSERGFFPSEGQIFYLYTEKVPGTVKVHRLYGVGDHMDSLWSEEGSDATAEFPGIYLRSNFNRFWTYIANTDDLNEVGVPLACPPGPGSLATELTSG